MYKRSNRLPAIPARMSAWLVLLCIFANIVPIFGQRNQKNSSDLTFCPLQKIWVPKYTTKTAVKEPLSEMCTSSSRKARFFFEASKRMPLLRFIRDSKEIEKLFFNYLKQGKQAFAVISSSRNLPEREFTEAVGEAKMTGGIFKIDFDQAEAEKFDLQQAARPPTVCKEALFEFLALIKLETVSRRIQPRAPPVLL